MIARDPIANKSIKTRLGWMLVAESPFIPDTYVHQTKASINKMTVTALPEGKWGAAIYLEDKLHVWFECTDLGMAMGLCEGYSISYTLPSSPDKAAVGTTEETKPRSTPNTVKKRPALVKKRKTKRKSRTVRKKVTGGQAPARKRDESGKFLKTAILSDLKEKGTE